jgi:hypothetical protein
LNRDAIPFDCKTRYAGVFRYVGVIETAHKLQIAVFAFDANWATAETIDDAAPFNR